MQQRPTANTEFEDLVSKYETLIATGADWHRLWRLIVAHEWFCRRLKSVAFTTLKKARLPAGRIDDVMQGAVVDIALSMQRDNGLRYRPERGDFAAFLSAVARRSCQKSIRQFKRVVPPEATLRTAVQDWQTEQNHKRLRLAIRGLPEPSATALRLLCNGLSIDEIAQKMKYSRRSTYRFINEGKKMLRKEF